MTNQRKHALLLTLSIAWSITACAAGPTTLAQVCTEYDQLEQAIEDDRLAGLFDGGVFDQIEKLGSVAERYEDGGAIADEGAQLKDLAGRNTISMQSIVNATRTIASSC